MGLQPNDLVEISIEHSLVALIAKSDKFSDYYRNMDAAIRNKHHNDYIEKGGLAKLGEFRMWLIKTLRLHTKGLKYWTGAGTVEEAFPDGLIPEIQPVGKGLK
jgi:hypothetical protein